LKAPDEVSMEDSDNLFYGQRRLFPEGKVGGIEEMAIGRGGVPGPRAGE